jgi:MFS superfamily sulfate permease-like transporter
MTPTGIPKPNRSRASSSSADAPLFFANAECSGTAVEAAMAESTTPVRWLVVAAEPVTDIDTTAADVIDTLRAELERGGVEFVFAELERTGQGQPLPLRPLRPH